MSRSVGVHTKSGSAAHSTEQSTHAEQIPVNINQNASQHKMQVVAVPGGVAGVPDALVRLMGGKVWARVSCVWGGRGRGRRRRDCVP